ncbi:hypothetical protein C0J52_27203 [Blattella germanica]|nr:hypothetical protein C0J52_27203 [Blattella germanica]
MTLHQVTTEQASWLHSQSEGNTHTIDFKKLLQQGLPFTSVISNSQCFIMRKKKNANNKVTIEETKKEEKQIDDISDDENQGFSNWLRSSDGVEYMKLFVLANTFVVFMTMTWPHMQEAIEIIKSFFNE